MPPRLLTKQDDRFIFAKETQQVPPYAILSHTWGETEQELTYRDIINGTGQEKDGYAKLLFCAEQAAKDNLQHFWIDTCCIKKEHDAELSTAIRSMFAWYAESKVCYVYLEDVSLKRDRAGNDLWIDAFRSCRWFKRGWTLQELLAPQDVRFFARSQSIGTRDTLCQIIHEITGIEIEALNGESFSDFNRKRRIAWAAGRQTKIPEDMVYALMGICGVSMSPRYGEGVALAKLRLERNIAKLHKLGVAAQPNTADSAEKLADARTEKLKRLRFVSMETRHNTIRRAFAKTCAWILEDPMYKSWLSTEVSNQHHGFLWIKGKPGAGKSVLMKSLHRHLHSTLHEDDILVSFYFNARGDDLEKSVKGMYRSLLVQLLNAAPHLQSVLDIEIDLDHIENVKHLMSTVVLELKHVWVLIDALDECQENEVHQMIDHFRDMGLDALDRQVELRVCFASRHYPIVEMPTGLTLVLEDLSDHATDLDDYINSSLRIGRSTRAKRLKEEIRDKANGVFLWVVLVVDILNKEYRNGRIHEMQRRVQETPRDLHDLFESIVHRNDDDKMNECALCFTWILFARRPLSLAEFYVLMMAALHQSTVVQPGEINVDEMHAFLLSSSRGLAELTREPEPRAQFVHESVRDYLLADGLRNLSQRPCSMFEAHESLMSHCWMACQAAQLWVDPLEHFEWWLEYATSNVLWHAEQASPTSQAAFLLEFDVKTWQKAGQSCLWSFDSVFDIEELTLADLCAKKDLPNLITVLANLDEDLHRKTWQQSERALLAAFDWGSWAAARAILAADGAINPNSIIDEVQTAKKNGYYYGGGSPADDDYGHDLRPFDQVMYHTGMSSWRSKESVWPSAFKSGLPALGMHLVHISNAHMVSAAQTSDIAFEAACLCGSLEGSRAALDVNPGLLDTEFSSGWTALRVCAKYGHTRIIQMLIDSGASVNLTSGHFHMTPLETAAQEGHIDICRILISAGADLGRASGSKTSALHVAAASDRQEVCELLIDAGADIEIRALGGSTALMHAVHNKHLEICKLLIGMGANPEARECRGNTALHLAARHGSTEVCQYLIGTARNLELRNDTGNTALHRLMASSRSWWLPGDDIDIVACLTMLLEAGANVRAENGRRETPLHCARQKECIELLLNHDGDLEARDKDGRTPLHSAAADAFDVEGILAFVRMGAKVDVRQNDGMTPLHSLLDHDHMHYNGPDDRLAACLAEMLHESNLHVRDKLGRTAMHLAAQNKLSWAMKVLLLRGASIDVADANGQTPRDLMQRWNKNSKQAQHCVKLMMESKPSD